MHKGIPQSSQLTARHLVSLEYLKTQDISRILVAVGSNHQASQHIALSKASLSRLADSNDKARFSSEFVNPDYSDSTKPEYTNLCADIILSSTIQLDELIHLFKSLERRTGRHTHTKLVTLDIDLLAVMLATDTDTDIDTNIDIDTDNQWFIIDKRYPFKSHEQVGIQELGILI